MIATLQPQLPIICFVVNKTAGTSLETVCPSTDSHRNEIEDQVPAKLHIVLIIIHNFFFSSCLPSLISSLQSNEVLGTQLVTLESEKEELVQSLSKVEAELAAQVEELERVQSSLATERESGVKTAEALQNQLNEKVKSQKHHSKLFFFFFFCFGPRGVMCASILLHRRAGSRHWRASW